MKINFNFWNRIFQVRYFKIPNAPVSGYTSRTTDGYHVLFLDYDMKNPEIIFADLMNLFKDKVISHAYIFTTFEQEDELGKVGNYHVVCLDRFRYYEILKIMELTHCDTLHKELAKKTRYSSWVLRFSGKGERKEPLFVKFIPNPNKKVSHIQSMAHYKLLHILYPDLKDEFKFNFDGLKETIVTQYNTASKLNENAVKNG